MKRSALPSLGGATAGLARRARSWLLDPDVPLVGLEFRAGSVAGLRLGRSGTGRTLAAAATAALPEGALIPSMTRANMGQAEAVKAAVRQVLERIGGLTARRVAVALPDTVARVVVLAGKDLEAGKGPLNEDFVRFRLREKVPFDMHGAQVAWQSLGAGAGRSILAAAMPRSVLGEYEDVCAAVGIEPGLVELASLALLRGTASLRAAGDWLLLNWDADHASVTLSRGGVPLLVRTLVDQAGAPAVLRELANTILYYRERLGGAGLAGALLRSSGLPAAEAAGVVGEALGLAPQVIDPLAMLGARETDGTGQALAAVGLGLLAAES